jgi:hypothetical protein
VPRRSNPNTPPSEGKAEQRGKRGDPSYAQVAGMIPLELRRRFKAKAALEGRDMSRVLEALIREYVEGE